MEVHFLRDSQGLGASIDHKDFLLTRRWGISRLRRPWTIIRISIYLSPIGGLEHSVAGIDASIEVSGGATLSTPVWRRWDVDVPRLRNLLEFLSWRHWLEALLTRTSKLAHAVFFFILLGYVVDGTLVPLIHHLLILIWKHKVAWVILFVRVILLVDGDGGCGLCFIHFLVCLFDSFSYFSFGVIYLLWPAVFISLELFKIKCAQPTISKWLQTFQIVTHWISRMDKCRFLFVCCGARQLPTNGSSQAVHVAFLRFVRDFDYFVI